MVVWWTNANTIDQLIVLSFACVNAAEVLDGEDWSDFEAFGDKAGNKEEYCSKNPLLAKEIIMS